MVEIEISSLSTFQKGKLAELYFEAECIKRGIDVLKPVRPDCRYDYVTLVGNVTKRIQVKWAAGQRRGQDGVIIVNLTRPRGTRGSKKRSVAIYDRSEIDLVFAYLPTLNGFIVLGPDVFHQKGKLSLRMVATKNGQRRLVRLAEDFRWEDQLLS